MICDVCREGPIGHGYRCELIGKVMCVLCFLESACSLDEDGHPEECLTVVFDTAVSYV